MSGSERKKRWRELHPERSREAERVRAQARRNGYWGQVELGQPAPRPCASEASYRKYEFSLQRYRQRLLLRLFGPGAIRWPQEELKAAFRARHADVQAQLDVALAEYRAMLSASPAASPDA